MVSRIKFVWCGLLALAVFLFASVGPVMAVPPSPGSGWQLVFSDEFNGTALDLTRWNKHYWWGRTNSDNSELEYYADDAFNFQNGYLRLSADRRSMGGFQYTSGMIASHDKFSFQYGYVEIRARVPAGRGLWPAFWLLPASRQYTSEIDVLEALGQEPTRVYMTNWDLNPNGNGDGFPIQSDYLGPDFSQAFHTYGVEWGPGMIIWYIDGTERFRTRRAVPHQLMYIIANLAVGGDWPGSPDANTPFPSYYDIDYIRVYQQTPALPFSTYLPMIADTTVHAEVQDDLMDALCKHCCPRLQWR